MGNCNITASKSSLGEPVLYVYSVTIATMGATSRQPNLPERAGEKLNFVAFFRRTALNASDELTGE